MPGIVHFRTEALINVCTPFICLKKSIKKRENETNSSTVFVPETDLLLLSQKMYISTQCTQLFLHRWKKTKAEKNSKIPNPKATFSK